MNDDSKVNRETLISLIIDLATENWNIYYFSHKQLQGFSERERKKYSNQLEWFMKKTKMLAASIGVELKIENELISCFVKENTVANIDSVQNVLIDLCIEGWKIFNTFRRMLLGLDAQDQPKYMNKIEWFKKRMQDVMRAAGLKLVNVEGQEYNPGIAATAINLDEFSDDDNLIVDKMLDPIIMGAEGIIRSGTVTVKEGK